MSNEKDFDFSLIVDDCESSDGQKRHQYFTAKENETTQKHLVLTIPFLKENYIIPL